MDLSASTAFAPEDCCALRGGRTYLVRRDVPRRRCAHVTGGADRDYACFPLAAHGETLGVLQLDWPAGTDPGRLAQADTLALVESVSEQIAVALANLALRQRLRQQSIRDGLTGAFNRRYLDECLEREISRARRRGQPLGVLMLDVDHFKRLNDTYGHEAGDAVLRDVGQALLQSVRTEDVVCRYGGEEFAILLPEIDAAMLMVRADAILATLRGMHTRFGGHDVGPVTASVGIATYPEHGLSGADLIRRADAALYEAKRAGRDRVHVA